MFWSNEEFLDLLAQQLSNDKNLIDMLPLGPSSSIILEFTQNDPAKDMNV